MTLCPNTRRTGAGDWAKVTTWQRPGGLATGPGYLAADLVGRLEAARPALDALLQPRSIAVVGASAETGTLGGLLFANLVASPFPGPVLPVNKKHPVVQGVAAYPDLTSCPVVPDLTVISVPAPAVASVVAEAGDLGVRAA
ncbi:MAG TPA: CoA-binding protein, partial [Acidimicrobiales bacterium]|nr:CoA-binding protein [Acidimicrobiales bacterium]